MKTFSKTDKKPVSRPLKPFIKKKAPSPAATVYIGNLSYERDEKGIRELFTYYGKVHSVEIIRDLETKKSKGYAFVKMDHPNDAQRAITALNGKIIDKRTVKASVALQNEESPYKKIITKDDFSQTEEVDKSLLKKKKISKEKQGLKLLIDMKVKKFKSLKKESL